jgi:hypothetical protein
MAKPPASVPLSPRACSRAESRGADWVGADLASRTAPGERAQIMLDTVFILTECGEELMKTQTDDLRIKNYTRLISPGK